MSPISAVPIIKDAGALVSPRLREIFALWRSLTPAGEFAPKREAIALSKVRGLAPWTWMIDVVDDGADFRMRIAGERVIEFLGRRYAGTLLSDVKGEAFFDGMRLFCTRIANTRSPLAIGPLPALHPGREYLEIEVLGLPLSQDGESVTGLFGGFDFRLKNTSFSTE